MTVEKLEKDLSKLPRNTRKLNSTVKDDIVEQTVEKSEKINREKTVLKSGRISNVERQGILQKIGEEARRRYKRNLAATGYKGEHFKKAFHYASNYLTFENHYWLDTGEKRLNEILKYLEYGTGLLGPLKRVIRSKKISLKTGKPLLLKFKPEEAFIYKRSVKGIKPGYMFTKAIESIRNERSSLQREIRLK